MDGSRDDKKEKNLIVVKSESSFTQLFKKQIFNKCTSSKIGSECKETTKSFLNALCTYSSLKELETGIIFF